MTKRQRAQVVELLRCAADIGLLDEVERLRRVRCMNSGACLGEPHTCEQELVASLEGKIDRLSARLALLEPVWEAAKEWRLACARKDSTPEEVGGLWAVFVAAIDAAVAKEGK